MKFEEIVKNVEIVNGEKLYLIDLERWNKFEIGQSIDGVSLGGATIFNLLNGMVEFVRKNEGFSLAFYRYSIGLERWRWLFCVLYKINTGWQRVQIEEIACENCGYKGSIANPTLPSLYDTITDKQSALNSAWKLQIVNCPTCGKQLSRVAIWAQS